MSDQENQERNLPKGVWLKTRDRINVSIYIYENRDGVFEAATQNKIEEERIKNLLLKETEVKAVFTIPPRSRLDRYIERSAKYYPETQTVLTNRKQLKSLLLKHHLESLDLQSPDGNSKIEIKKDERGVRISDETEELLDGLHPTIIELLLEKYVTNADLMI